MSQAPTRPLLRYHGGKWVLAPWIIQHFPEHETYVEPYGGAASVLLRKPRAYAEIYNDLDYEIVNLFQVMRTHGAILHDELLATPFARVEFELAYEPSRNPIEQARRTVIKSHMGFGSDGIRNKTGFRAYARKNRYTIPAHDWANFVEVFEALVKRLRGVVIEHMDALKVIEKYDDPATLFYVDPPYVHDTRSSDKMYRHEMSDAQHKKLAKALRKCKGKVALSAYESPLYEKLYKGWNKFEREARADGARPRREILWTNYEPEKKKTTLELYATEQR